MTSSMKEHSGFGGERGLGAGVGGLGFLLDWGAGGFHDADLRDDKLAATL